MASIIKSILVSVSHAPAAAAETAMAVEIAQRHRASVTGFTVVDPSHVMRVGPGAVGTLTYQMQLMETRMKRANAVADAAMKELRERCEKAGIAFDARHQEGRPDRTLLDVWRFRDLCLMPTRPWAPGESGSHDVTAVLHLVAMGLRPLIAVPDGAPVTPDKALVALSGSLDSAKAFKHFVQLGIWPGIALHLVSVGTPKSGEAPAQLLAEAAAFATAHGYPVTTAALEAADDRNAALLAEAETVGAGILVIGSSYRRFMTLERFGRHASGLLQQSELPLFISH